MNKSTFSLAAAALALTAGTALYAHNHGAMPNPDANGDGNVTKAELVAHANEMFAKMDTNGDGKLDAADRAAMKAKMFAELDADHDGQVTAAEMKLHHEARADARAERRETRMEEHFARLDTDKSGGLSAAELEAGHRGKGGEGRHGQHGKRDGKPDGGDHGPGHRMGAGGPGMMMGKMADADGDRTVTKAEFVAAAVAHFATADANGDGTVSADEMKAMHARMGGRPHEHAPGEPEDAGQ